jgi:hypothetical protein
MAVTGFVRYKNLSRAPEIGTNFFRAKIAKSDTHRMRLPAT